MSTATLQEHTRAERRGGGDVVSNESMNDWISSPALCSVWLGPEFHWVFRYFLSDFLSRFRRGQREGEDNNVLRLVSKRVWNHAMTHIKWRRFGAAPSTEPRCRQIYVFVVSQFFSAPQNRTQNISTGVYVRQKKLVSFGWNALSTVMQQRTTNSRPVSNACLGWNWLQIRQLLVGWRYLYWC